MTGPFPEGLDSQVSAALTTVEEALGAHFGERDNPLLVSVRSGARASMPGMMDTVLNLGLNDETVEGLARHSGDRRFAFDSYRRFIQMFSDVVLGVDHHNFEEILELHKEDRSLNQDTNLTSEDWETVIDGYKARIEEETDAPFPQDPKAQVWSAIGAVFGSWMNPRANHLPAHPQHPPGLGHGGQRSGHGVRQHGRGLRHRGRLHPQPVHRRQPVLRRISGQRPGRGTWWQASARRST